MGIFNNNNKEEKALAKQQKKEELERVALQIRGLDNLKDEKTKDSCLKIIKSMKSVNLMDLGSFLSGNSTKDTNILIKEYLGVLLEQNWILIKQLDELANKKDTE